MSCEHCGDPITPPTESLVAAGGWCAPSETLYDLPSPTLCGDCKARMLMIMELGFDPGRHGENLRFPRGGIQYNTEEKK